MLLLSTPSPNLNNDFPTVSLQTTSFLSFSFKFSIYSFIHSSPDTVFVHALSKIPLPKDSTNILPVPESTFPVTNVICTVMFVSSTFRCGQFDAKCFVESHS